MLLFACSWYGFEGFNDTCVKTLTGKATFQNKVQVHPKADFFLSSLYVDLWR